MEDRINIRFVGMEPTEAIKDVVMSKFTKHPELLTRMTSIDIYLKQNVYSRGVGQDFTIDVDSKFPKSSIHVREVGEDMYALIDKGSDVFFRRVKRYNDKIGHWDGGEPWKVQEAEITLPVVDVEDDFVAYTPTIVARNSMEFMSPMAEAEAIERMELSGLSQYLFKRTDGKWCMVYVADRGYGVVEQANGVE